jgi:hypothetical protein
MYPAPFFLKMYPAPFFGDLKDSGRKPVPTMIIIEVSVAGIRTLLITPIRVTRKVSDPDEHQFAGRQL